MSGQGEQRKSDSKLVTVMQRTRPASRQRRRPRYRGLMTPSWRLGRGAVHCTTPYPLNSLRPDMVVDGRARTAVDAEVLLAVLPPPLGGRGSLMPPLSRRARGWHCGHGLVVNQSLN